MSKSEKERMAELAAIAATLPPLPINEALPLPDPTRYRQAKLRRWTFNGPLSYRIVNTSGKTAFFLASVFFFMTATPGTVYYLQRDDWELLTTLVAIWHLCGLACIGIGIYGWFTGDVYRVVFNRAGCEPGCSIGTVFRQDEVIFHDLVSWRDLKLVEAHAPISTGQRYRYDVVLSLAYDWPPGAYNLLSESKAHEHGLVLMPCYGGIGRGVRTLRELQLALGRPPGTTYRDAIARAIDWRADEIPENLRYEGENEARGDEVIPYGSERDGSRHIWLDN